MKLEKKEKEKDENEEKNVCNNFKLLSKSHCELIKKSCEQTLFLMLR
jgi:hypothetical protein